jgi:hypothetical protein
MMLLTRRASLGRRGHQRSARTFGSLDWQGARSTRATARRRPCAIDCCVGGEEEFDAGGAPPGPPPKLPPPAFVDRRLRCATPASVLSPGTSVPLAIDAPNRPCGRPGLDR